MVFWWAMGEKRQTLGSIRYCRSDNRTQVAELFNGVEYEQLGQSWFISYKTMTTNDCCTHGLGLCITTCYELGLTMKRV